MAIAISIGTNTPKLVLGLGGREGGGPFVPRVSRRGTRDGLLVITIRGR